MLSLFIQRRRAFATALVLMTSSACSTTATIARVRGPSVDGHIAGSDRENIYVRTAGGRAAAIPRQEITDIDHPGDTATVIGGLLTAYGAINIGVAQSQCEAKGSAFCLGVFSPAIVGLSMVIWGLVTHSESVSALDNRYHPRVALVPGVANDDNAPAPGGTLLVPF